MFSVLGFTSLLCFFFVILYYISLFSLFEEAGAICIMKIIFSLETGFLTGNNYIHTHAPTNQPASQPTNKQSRVSVSIQRPLSHSTSHRSTNRLKRPLYRPSLQPISLRMWCSFQIYRLINKTKAQKKTKSVVSKCCIVPSVLSSFCLHFTHAESMGWPNKSADFLYFKKIQPQELDKKKLKRKSAYDH